MRVRLWAAILDRPVTCVDSHPVLCAIQRCLVDIPWKKMSDWDSNFSRPFPRGNCNQPIPVVFTMLTLRVWEQVSWPQPLSVAACFISGHTFVSYIIHDHWVYFPR
jgi:hypothetical protein